jgi:acetyltransferase-like isoleucine patch superfamily enzyme
MRQHINKVLRTLIVPLVDLEASCDYPPTSSSRRQALQLYLRLMLVRFEAPIWSGVGFRIFGAGAIRLGRGCSIGNYSVLTSHGMIDIGRNFLCSSHFVANSGTHDIVSGKPRGTVIRIGDNVWAGVRVTIIEDTVVGDNSVIAAGSVLRGDYPPNSLIAGVPAKVIRPIERHDGDKMWSVFGE